MNHSKQRELIYNIVCSNHNHPTAKEVYVEARKVMPNISLGTVYRNLNQLAEINDLIKIDCGDNESRFDGTITDHIHFFCTKCNTLSDVDSPSAIKELKVLKKIDSSFKVENASVVLKGICNCCYK